MPENDTIEQVPQPGAAETAGAAGVLSGAGDLPLAPARDNTAVAAAPPPANPEHTRVGGMFHAALDTLTGKQTEPSIDARGVITEQPVHRTGGEWARRMLAGALTGMASGAAHPGRPGAGAAGGLGAGFEGEREALAEQDATKRAELQQNFRNQQAKQKQDQEASAAADESLLRKAQIAHTTTLNASAGFDLARKKAEASEESINAFNTFQKLIAADPANVDLGVFPDMAAVIAYQKVHPELVHQISGGHDSGQITAIPSLDENGVHNGVRAALVHPSQMDRPLSEVFPNPDDAPTFQYRVPGKMVNGKPGPDEWKTAAFAPGTKFGDALAMNQKTAADASAETLKKAQIAHEEAQTKEILEGKNKPPVQETAFDKATAESAAKDVETARGGDFRFRSMSGSYPLALKGDQQAMMNILTNHIGMTLGMQKGARITKDILHEAQTSRPWLQGLQATFDKQGFLSGVVLTKEQMQQMMTLSTSQRSNAWAQAVESARQGGVAAKVQIPSDVRILMKAKDGRLLTIPGSSVSKALDNGYEVAAGQ
jgi:hypothetical protein